MRVAAFAAALYPLLHLLAAAYTDDLTANPIEYLTNQTGFAALVLLILSLGVTPARRLTGWNEIIKLRRMLGLFAFFYGCLHLLVWIVLDKFFDLPIMVEDIAERPFITIGMATWLLLLPLALTSTQASIRRLGRRWQTLHRLAYVAAITGVIHFWWKVKADTREPQLWAFVLSLFLGFRLWRAWSTRRAAAARAV